jgi:hypothetical protein
MTKLAGRIHRPSPALIVAIIALIAALAGGAYAAKKIGTKQLANKSVTTKKLVKSERSQGFFTKQGGEISLPPGADTTVATLNLPTGGNYQVTSVTSLGNFASAANVRCQLRDQGVVLTAGDSRLNNIAANQFQNTITLTWFSDGGVVTLTCNPDNAALARDRVIAATRVARVETQQ